MIDPLHKKLKDYHDNLLSSVDKVATEKLTAEVAEVVNDMKLIDDINRQFKWTIDDETRLNKLNVDCKSLKVPCNWLWAADDDSEQGRYNKARMEFWAEKELQTKIIHCPRCKSTGVLVGIDQIDSSLCYDCLLMNNKHVTKTQQEFDEAWNKV